MAQYLYITSIMRRVRTFESIHKDVALQPPSAHSFAATTCTNCSGGVSGTGPGCSGWLPGTQFFGYWGALRAPSAAGPWTQTRLGSCDPTAADYVPGCAANGNDLNPTGVTDPATGAVSLVWRSIDWASKGRSFVARGSAPAWDGPYYYNTTDMFDLGSSSDRHIEDPFVYKSRDGSWHLLLHADADGSCGGAAGMHGWYVLC